MEAWIQKHDFSTDPIHEPTVEGCLELLHSFEWDAELAKYEEALEAKRDRCPPGIALVDKDRTLQVLPISEGKSHYSYSCDHPVRWLALFGASKSINAWAISDEHRQNLIGLHFGGEQEQLVRTLSRLTKEPA